MPRQIRTKRVYAPPSRDANRAALAPLIEVSGVVTLLFATHDSEHNNAIALAAYLEGQNSAS